MLLMITHPLWLIAIRKPVILFRFRVLRKNVNACDCTPTPKRLGKLAIYKRGIRLKQSYQKFTLTSLVSLPKFRQCLGAFITTRKNSCTYNIR